MNSLEEKVLKNHKAIIAILTLFGSAFVYFNSSTCDSLALKWILIAILAISCFFFCSMIYKYTQGSNVNSVTLLAICILIFILMSVLVYTKKCPQKESDKVNVDKSIYNDHSTHYNVNKLPQRTFNDDDLAELKSKLGDKKAKVIVQYLKSCVEDTLICRQIIVSLNRLGFTNVAQSEATTLPDDLQHGRMTIRREIIDKDTLFKIIINPQQ